MELQLRLRKDRGLLFASLVETPRAVGARQGVTMQNSKSPACQKAGTHKPQPLHHWRGDVEIENSCDYIVL